MPTRTNLTPTTNAAALRSGAMGGVSVALPAAAVLMLAKAWRQERRRADIASSKDSDTLVITLPEKRGGVLGDLGAKAKEFGSGAADIAKAVGSGVRSTAAAVASTPEKIRRTKDAIGGVLTLDNAATALGSLARRGIQAASDATTLSAGAAADVADLPEASRQALKYLAAVVSGGVVLRGADALYETYNRNRLKRLEEASRREYINRLFAKDAQAPTTGRDAVGQDGQVVGGIMALMALLAGTSAYGTKKVLDVMYPKTYSKVQAPTVRRIEFRSLPRDAHKSDSVEEYEEFQGQRPAVKAAAIMDDGTTCDVPWDVVWALGLRQALLQDARDNGLRKFASHEAVLDWCAERLITPSQLREKLAQDAQMANPQQQAELYRVADDIMKSPELLGKVDEIAQSAADSGRADTSMLSLGRLQAEGGNLLNRMRPGYVPGPHLATISTRKAILEKTRQEIAGQLAGKFGLAMPGFASAMSDSALTENIAARVKEREPELRALVYKSTAGNSNVAAMLAKNVRDTVAYKAMPPTLKKVMDWLGSREQGSLPRMLYDWLVKRQVNSALRNAGPAAAESQAAIFANAPPTAAPAPAAPPTAAAAAEPKNPDGTLNVAGAAAAAVPKPAQPPTTSPAPAQATPPVATPARAPAPAAPQSIPGDWGSPGNWSNAASERVSVGGRPAPPITPMPTGARNAINGNPFATGADFMSGTSKVASSGISPASLAEKLLATPKPSEDDGGESDATRDSPTTKRRRIDVEAMDPRAEAFVRKNKQRLVAALSNAVNSGAL